MDLDDWQPPSEAEMKIIQARQERCSKISQLMSTYLLKGYKMLSSICSVCDTILLQDRQGNNYCVACSELDSDGDKDNPVVNQAAASSLARELSSSSSNGIKQKEVPTPTCTYLASNNLCGGDARVRPGLSEPVTTPRLCLSEPVTTPRPIEIASPQPSAMRAIKIETFEQEDGAIGSSSFADWNRTRGEQARTSGEQVGLDGHPTQRYSSHSSNVDILLDKVNWACQAVKETKDVEYCTRLCLMIKAAVEAIDALKKANI